MCFYESVTVHRWVYPIHPTISWCMTSEGLQYNSTVAELATSCFQYPYNRVTVACTITTPELHNLVTSLFAISISWFIKNSLFTSLTWWPIFKIKICAAFSSYMFAISPLCFWEITCILCTKHRQTFSDFISWSISNWASWNVLHQTQSQTSWLSYICISCFHILSRFQLLANVKPKHKTEDKQWQWIQLQMRSLPTNSANLLTW